MQRMIGGQRVSLARICTIASTCLVIMTIPSIQLIKLSHYIVKNPHTFSKVFLTVELIMHKFVLYQIASMLNITCVNN